MKKVKLFFTGYVQVMLVAVSTYCISNEYYVGSFLAAYSIGIVWTFNVKKANAATKLESHVYSLGSALGAITGLYFSKNAIQFIQYLLSTIQNQF